MPLGIAEVGIPGLLAAPVPATIPSSCSDDLLSVDGKPLWVAISGSSATALARQALTVSLCGPDAGGVALGPGDHTLEAVPGQTSGFDIDQLALDSAPGGGPMPLASPTTLAAPTVAPSPAVHVESQSSTSIRLSVEGMNGSAGQPPVNLILGESINAGWRASVVGGPDLGPPALIDGYANGWRLDPSSLPPGAVHDGAVTVALTWQPQRTVDIALLLSALAIIACLVLVFVPPRRRRRRRGRHARTSGTEGADVQPLLSLPADPRDRPHLAVPFAKEAPRAPAWVALLSGAITGGLAAVIATPLAGLAVGVASAVVLLVPRLRIVLGLAAIAGIVAAGECTAATQAAQHVPPNGSWPLSFQTAADYAWAGVVFLGADAMVEVVLRRRRAREGEAVPEDTDG